MEDAARNNELDALKQMTPIFLKKWRKYKELLKELSDMTSSSNSSTKNATEYQEQIEEIFYKIQEAAEDIDIDALDEALAELEEYRFEGTQAEKFEQIKEAVINLDTTFLQSII